MKKSGFSFIEFLIGMAFLSLAFFGFMLLNSTSAKGGMDAYFELLGAQLAHEPIEVLTGLGYNGLAEYKKHPSLENYPLDQEISMEDSYNRNPRKYPYDAVYFKRKISISEIRETPTTPPGYELTVSVYPRTGTKLSFWFGQKVIISRTILFKEVL